MASGPTAGGGRGRPRMADMCAEARRAARHLTCPSGSKRPRNNGQSCRGGTPSPARVRLRASHSPPLPPTGGAPGRPCARRRAPGPAPRAPRASRRRTQACRRPSGSPAPRASSRSTPATSPRWPARASAGSRRSPVITLHPAGFRDADVVWQDGESRVVLARK